MTRIGISTYGTPEKDPERRASSIDIYNNDMHLSNDDFIETDGGVHNIRVFNNRGVNAAQGGYSSQPIFGGPVYFFRNILYNVPSGVAFKFSAKPAGLFVYHNTIIGEQIAARSVRERALPQQPVPWPGHSRSWHHDVGQCDGRLQHGLQRFSPEQGSRRPVFMAGTGGRSTLYEPKPEDWKTFGHSGRFPSGNGQETHGIEVDFDIFEESAAAESSQAPRGLSRDGPELPAEARQQSRGCGRSDPDVNDGFTGRAPTSAHWKWASPSPSMARAG